MNYKKLMGKNDFEVEDCFVHLAAENHTRRYELGSLVNLKSFSLLFFQKQLEEENRYIFLGK